MGLRVWSLAEMPGPWGTVQFRWRREEPGVGLGGRELLGLACLWSQLWKDLTTPTRDPNARPPCHSTCWSRAHWKVGAVRLARGLRTFLRGLGRRFFLLLQKTVLFPLPSPSSEASRRRGGRGELLRGWAALQSVLIVCHRNVSPEAAAGLARVRRCGWSPSGLARARPRRWVRPSRRNGAVPAGGEGRRAGLGGGRPGPEGPARGSTLPVRPWTG